MNLWVKVIDKIFPILTIWHSILEINTFWRGKTYSLWKTQQCIPIHPASYSSHSMFCLIMGILIYGSMTPCVFASNDNTSDPDNKWFKSILGVPGTAILKISDPELQSLGCIVGGGSAAIGTIILSSTAIIVSGGQGAATATEIAVPVLAAATMAGCVVGNSAALGFAWILRNKEKLFGKIVDTIPANPLTNILPKPSFFTP